MTDQAGLGRQSFKNFSVKLKSQFSSFQSSTQIKNKNKLLEQSNVHTSIIGWRQGYEQFLTPISTKRLIKPRNPTDFKTTNIVTDHARNNSQSYRVDPTKIAVYRYSPPPSSRTTIDWNILEQETVSSKTAESSKTQISHCP